MERIGVSKGIRFCFSQDMQFMVTYQDSHAQELWKKLTDQPKEIKS